MKAGEPLSKAARSALLDYRAARTPSPAASSQALLDVERRLREGQVEIDWDHSDAPAAGNGAASSGSVGKWLGLSGIAVAVGAGVLFMTLENTPTVTSAPTIASTSVDIDVPSPMKAAEAVVAPAPGTVSEAPPSERIEALEPKPTTEKRPLPTNPVPPTPEPAATSTLREEMALLSRGQAAFNAEDYQGALAAFDEHRSRFPSGALASERELKRIATLCRMGRKTEARAAADVYASRRPGSPSAEKAQSICAEAP